MIGSMIKVCSLDFLNKQFFESDIKTAEGKVLFAAGSRITPNIILKLYFKDIFIDEVAVVNEVRKIDLTDDVSVNDFASKISPSKPNLEEDSEILLNKAPKTADVKLDEVKQAPEKSPRAASISLDVEAKEEKSGPQRPMIDLDSPDLKEKDTSKTSANESGQSPSVEEVQEVVSEYLEFDEKQALKMSEMALSFAKILKTPASDYEDIKNAAYYCNVGFPKFKREEQKLRGFEDRKAYESAKIVLNQGHSDRVVEAIKFHTLNYESTSFQLGRSIPHSHIVGVVCFYSNMLAQGHSKQQVLEKMLQHGGNKFNVFILHKFIKMMRDAND